MNKNWYYPRGLKSAEWRKKCFRKYSIWLWDKELFEKEVSHIDKLLYRLKPYIKPFFPIHCSKSSKFSWIDE